MAAKPINQFSFNMMFAILHIFNITMLSRSLIEGFYEPSVLSFILKATLIILSGFYFGVTVFKMVKILCESK